MCDQGCTYYSLLIVTGPARGRVVNIDVDGQPPTFAQEADFLSWYERWLAETLAGYKMDWFGFGMAGTECDFVRVAQDLQQTSERRAQALVALCRLPRLSAAGEDAVMLGLRDTEATVRAAAARVASMWKIEAATASVAGLLSDADAGVREAATYALKVLSHGE